MPLFTQMPRRVLLGNSSPLLVVVKQIKSMYMVKKAPMVNHFVERKKC